MPIYAYRCDDCGFAKDVLQKLSDAPLTDCPSCGKSSFTKQLTAAGFQLKGTGWYATDFRNAGGKAAESKAAESKPAETAAKPADSGTSSPSSSSAAGSGAAAAT